MLNLMRITALFSIALIIGCATGPTVPSGKTFDSPIGEWTERYEIPYGSPLSSRFTITDETTGIYTHPVRVDFYAIDEQRNWKGIWVNLEASYSYACLEERNGSLYWGEAEYQFNETYNQYTGFWNFCGEDQKFASKGVR